MLDAEDIQRRLDEIDYLVDDGMATALFLALTLEQPLLLEGEPGVGKTTAAKALARAMGAPLIRLQCYEGLTASEALYEWNYQRQLLAIRLAESRHESLADADLFTEEFLQERPILKAIRTSGPVAPVLLIDEIDRADDEFEALLFEFLGEASITIPEIGTFVAEPPSGGGADVEPQPRAARCLAPSLSLSLDRLPGTGESGRDPAEIGPVRERCAHHVGHRLHRAGSRPGPRQGARDGRDHRLGVRAHRLGCRCSGAPRGRSHPQCDRQDTR